MSGLNPHGLKETRNEQLRRKMITHTENYLRGQLRKVGTLRRAAYRGSDNVNHHPQKGPQENPRAPRPAPIEKTNSRRVGAWLEVSTNEHGHVDEDHLDALVVRLLNLTQRRYRGDVLLDLSRVRSISTHFMQVVEAARDNLRRQQRRLVLYGTADCVQRRSADD